VCPIRGSVPQCWQKKIRLVEDNSDIRKVLGLRLEQSGYDTVEAANGHEAFAAETAEILHKPVSFEWLDWWFNGGRLGKT
jgi:DNA-binding response OmpR family regulator